jgi:endonuclease/exonuclease/phosphatase (EEP) superfamily protein YafD
LLRTTITYSLLSALALGTLGQLVRDRAFVLMLFMFVPVLHVAVVALLWDAMLRGRALGVRWLLACVAIGCGASAVSGLWQPALAPAHSGTSARVRLVQWNALWGGETPESLAAVLDAIDAQQADVVCLSEAPRSRRLRQAWDERHAGWNMASVGSRQSESYWYNLTVLSRYPVKRRQEWQLSTGHAALFDVSLPVRTLRVLIADLESSPRKPRSPSIRELAALVDARARTSEPIDVVLGDFNTPARFLGFDALAAAGGGFKRTALWSGQWRGTWPDFVPLPAYDIDHVWVSARWGVLSSRFFGSRRTDHRGQRVDLRLP